MIVSVPEWCDKITPLEDKLYINQDGLGLRHKTVNQFPQSSLKSPAFFQVAFSLLVKKLAIYAARQRKHLLNIKNSKKLTQYATCYLFRIKQN